jgi:hypothetical protein
MVSLNLKLNYTKIFISSPGNLYSNNRACQLNEVEEDEDYLPKSIGMSKSICLL